MNKPNEKQKATIKYLRDQLEYWEQTNDLYSPSHNGNIYQFISSLDHLLTIEQKTQLEETTNDLLNHLRRIH